MPDDVLLEAGAAAEVVGVSASGLRRLAPIYEAVHGELPRKPKSNNRLWPQTAIERLQAARQLVERECYRTISEALTALTRGIEADEVELAPTAARVSPDATQRALEVLTAEVRQLRQEVAMLRQLPNEQKTIETISDRNLYTHSLLVKTALRIEAWMKRLR